jgi:sporulation protein YhbH
VDSVIVDSDFPHDLSNRGARDARRHNKKVQEAARKQLKDIITSQDIITSSGNKKVKVRLKYLDQYQFRHYPDRTDVVGRDEYDELDAGEVISRPESGQVGGRPIRPGNEEGEELYEVEFTVDDLTNLMIDELSLPNLDDSIKSEIVSEVIEWTDRRKSSGIHALIDKKQTLLANIQRKAKMGHGREKKVSITNDDLRFRTWEIQSEKHSNAVIFLMMDRSGSMWEDKIYACKAFFFWVVQFLKKKYDRVEIRFISHDVTAKEMPEKDFFTISDSGGTRVSSAYELCRDMIKYEYPSNKWNIYCFHASDGDTWGDEEQCGELIANILDLGAKLFGYVEIQDEYNSGVSSLWSAIEGVAQQHRRVMMTSIGELDDILEAIEHFFSKRTKAQVRAK